MVGALNYKQSPLYPSQISQFERGERQPPLLLALAYARLAVSVWMCWLTMSYRLTD